MKNLAKALAKAQGEMKFAAKDSNNPFFKSKYADLASVWDACRDALTKNGLSVIQIPGMYKEGNTEMFCLETILLHESGEQINGHYPIRPVKDDPQGVGSAITYARRYALAAMVGISQADDDGQKATKKPIVTVKKEVVEDVVSGTLKALSDWNKEDLEEIWSEFGIDEQAVLWKNFNSKERASIKRLKNGEEN